MELKPNELPKTLHVRVTNRDIIDGNSRCGYSCALALAINRALPGDWCCGVITYAAHVEAAGIRFYPTQYACREAFRLPIRELPDDMIQWSMDFDDWKDCKSMGIKEWRMENGKDEYRPYRPSPWEFDLDLTKLVEAGQ